jgi:hypothetical protein
MRTPIIVRSGSIELLTAKPLDESQSGSRFVYRLRGSQGGAAVDTFEISNCNVHVRDDSGVGARRLDIWLTGTPAGSPAFTVDASLLGLKVTTDRRLTRQSRTGGRPFLYVYDAHASQYAYDLHRDGARQEGRNLDQAAFVISLEDHGLLKYLALGAAAGVVGALAVHQLAPRTHRSDRDE